MSYTTFTWEVSNQTTGTTKIASLEAQFGEGVSQVAADGISPPPRTVNVDISPIEEVDSVAIHAFLDAANGQPFLWTPLKPLPQVQGLWRSKDYGFKRFGNTIHGITATFIFFSSYAP